MSETKAHPSGATALSAGFETYPDRISRYAAERGDATAVVEIRADGTRAATSWGALEARIRGAAALLRERGVRKGGYVVVAAGNSLAQLVGGLAAWKLGACVLPVNAGSPPAERDAVLELCNPDAVIAEWSDLGLDVQVVAPQVLMGATDVAPFASEIADPGRAIATGGSTGWPKIIIRPGPLGVVGGRPPAVVSSFGFDLNQTQLVSTAMYHNAAFTNAVQGLVFGHRLIVMQRFEPRVAVDLIREFQVSWIYLVPTMMKRILDLGDVEKAALASVTTLYHTAAACPEWVKQAWIELLGPERIRELYGASEGTGYFVATGSEWLARPGTVGRPVDCDVRVLDESGRDVPVGTVGEIYLRPWSTSMFRYLGTAKAATTEDGYVSVGDMGHVDADGYLYIADRRLDMIVTGGVNVYPAQVEGSLMQHPAVGDSAVIGLPDPDWGQRIHAIVEPKAGWGAPSAQELTEFLRARLSREKLPKSYEFVSQLPREESGKIRRSALRSERPAVPGA